MFWPLLRRVKICKDDCDDINGVRRFSGSLYSSQEETLGDATDAAIGNHDDARCADDGD
jgi:hypothetical protein